MSKLLRGERGTYNVLLLLGSIWFFLSVCIGAKDKLWLLNFPSKMPKWREDLIMQTRGRMDSRLRHGKSADMGGHSLWDTAFINLVVEQQFQKILSKLMNM